MHRKGHTTRRRKLKGGFYGAAGQIPGAPGAMQWNKGTEVAPPSYVKGGSRRRKSKKVTRRHRKMRGGGKFGGVSASFQGTGSRGMANYTPIVTRDGSGSAAGGAFNNYGAQPGSGFGSFIKSA
jgi:hypothetical protein